MLPCKPPEINIYPSSVLIEILGNKLFKSVVVVSPSFANRTTVDTTLLTIVTFTI
jgi:hypothetical protein